MANHSKSYCSLFVLLFIILILSSIVALKWGTFTIETQEVLSMLWNKLKIGTPYVVSEENEIIFNSIRLPRVLMAALVGATLAICGAGMQALLRNPLADPGLLGVSSGASLFVTATIVIAPNLIEGFSLPIIAFTGSLLAMFLIFALSKLKGHMNVTTIILIGIAINAFFSSLTSFFIFLSNNEQLRSITFWQLGSLGSANWQSVMMFFPFALLAIVVIPFFAKSLNAFILGESNAQLVGVNVSRVKIGIIFLVSIGVGSCVAVCGVIGFVGLVVPHLVRLWLGSEHKRLLFASTLLGAILMILADLLSRILISPIEIPIGVVTAMLGAPFFLFLILKNKKGKI